jgi:predicted 3-demethylubiquinone-9 3-methyltransferase (glyoxalase superfamily)
MTRITPFLWFASQAEEAAQFYTSIFERSRVLTVGRYGDAGPGSPGSVMTVSFELDGEAFVALNGGQQPFHFNESISFVVNCSSQAGVDYFWGRLTEGGEERSLRLAEGQVRLVVANSPRAVDPADH